MGPPPPRVGQTDRQACMKTLPSRTLRMRAVIISFTHFSQYASDDSAWCGTVS